MADKTKEVGRIYTVLPAITNRIGAIDKNKKNLHQNYNYRSIDDIYNALNPLFGEYEVFVSSQIIKDTREERKSKEGGLLLYTILTIEFTFWASDGSHITTQAVGEAMDSGDKSSNKAMATAYKYAMMHLFCIPTKEEIDTEKYNPEPAPRDEKLLRLKALKSKISDGSFNVDNKDAAIRYFANSVYAEEVKQLLTDYEFKA